jgi:hypothetical protein
MVSYGGGNFFFGPKNFPLALPRGKFAQTFLSSLPRGKFWKGGRREGLREEVR